MPSMKKKELKEKLRKYEDALIAIADGSKHALAIAEKALGIVKKEEYQPELLWEENHELKLQLEKAQTQLLKNLFKNTDVLMDKNVLTKEEEAELDRCYPNKINPVQPPFGCPNAKEPIIKYGTGYFPSEDYHSTSASYSTMEIINNDEEPIGPRKFA